MATYIALDVFKADSFMKEVEIEKQNVSKANWIKANFTKKQYEDCQRSKSNHNFPDVRRAIKLTQKP